jgi:3-methylcrotonyl-CoA carboxylase alpha subunit
MREQMGAAAVAAARAVNYVGAGTVEFIVEQKPDGSMTFFFMEMNTRLQVEHPVTEAITGLDLVEWQLRVASGEPLPLQQSELKINGHAIEARICAETPDNNFLPATGTLHVYGLPPCTSFALANQGVRVDSGVRQGDTISPFYDSMVAKLIVHGSTREEALARMDAALMQTHIVGLATNVQFLRHVVGSSSFATAQLDTALIPREAAVLFNQDKVGLPLAAAALVAHTLDQEAQAALDAQKADARGWIDPWARRDSWRSHGASLRRFATVFKDEPQQLQFTRGHEGALQIAVQGGAPQRLQFQRLQKGGVEGVLDITLDSQRIQAQVYAHGEVLHVFTPLGATSITRVDALAHAGDAQSEAGRLTAPMPGKVVSFAVKAGDVVKKGQPLAIMDAMKMEHTIAAPADGTVAELLFAPGDQVTEGAELLRLEVAETVAA